MNLDRQGDEKDQKQPPKQYPQLLFHRHELRPREFPGPRRQPPDPVISPPPRSHTRPSETFLGHRSESRSG